MYQVFKSLLCQDFITFHEYCRTKKGLNQRNRPSRSAEMLKMLVRFDLATVLKRLVRPRNGLSI
jgi:hypothetical protein